MSATTGEEIPDETALYRILGEADLLLYIGISRDFGQRWRQHAKKQPWWDEKRRLTVDKWFDYRSKAEAAEEAAIKAERPKYNKRHLLPPPKPRKTRHAPKAPPAGWLEVSDAAKRAGCTRQRIQGAERGGQIKVQRTPGAVACISEAELERWIGACAQPKPQKARPARPVRLTERQEEFLLDVYLGRDNQDYSAIITTRRALRRRGLIAGRGLTTEGERVARELNQQKGAEVATA